MTTPGTQQQDPSQQASIGNGIKLDVMAVDFHAFNERLVKVEANLERNNEMTALLLELFSAAKTGFKVLGWVGEVVKWAGMIAGGAVAMYAAWKSFGGK
ncbi:hypothetical protein HF313_09740 [Massilia atriviolacea]|uniref:Uncharacterized protein n=1 Tax=Massilia atriviolacea TaxID=2495579 RepID=A0A430HF58_9BURK|nr:hypothetical protein [Massilia atriviolacea]RSZ56143.1 hypothetical protein EJB06_26255 [Massilia atriviolacea]